MRRAFYFVAVSVLIVLAVGCGSNSGIADSDAGPHDSDVSGTDWPLLPNDGFVSGRAATIEDVEVGSAGFVLQADGRTIGEPIDIAIPQYAWHLDQESGVRTAGVIIQAESAQGSEMAAMRTVSGELLVGFLWEFELLGTDRPTR